ncbi:MAG: hypothetical protein WC140_01120 [Bacteroidales bacterium]
MLRTNDNNCGINIEENLIPDLDIIANKKISKLVSEGNHNLLIFPSDLDVNKDKIGESNIFDLDNNLLTTHNVMGFIGINNTEVTIQSRFAQNGKDYFLHYMLKKVFSINLVDLKYSFNNENVFDFLLYIFPYYLKKALRQGLYKEYHRKEYNNANVKGAIDINRQIKYNMPFLGNIAYRVKEYSYDNKITQLIRHTIEFIKQRDLSQGILYTDTETQNCVDLIKQATPTYTNNDRTKIINENLKPFSHPYFFEYNGLKKICLQILRHEGLKFGEDKDKIYGLLFDGAWLWEEYLNTFLIDLDFKHPQNKVSKGAFNLFKDRSGYKRYPDFIKDNFILDAKYKRLDHNGNDWVNRDDMNQIISYMYIKSAMIGGFICPNDDNFINTCRSRLGELNGYGGEVFIWRLRIPKGAESFTEFCEKMGSEEEKMKDKINEECL